jgi:hypothetical protein
VDGWRFAVSPATTSTIPPRPAPSFSRLCGSTAAQEGHKRVGLVVDFGTTGDAPAGESPPSPITTCAVVPDDANGYEVLMTVAQLRTDDSGLICGVNGFPATECGVPVTDPTSSPSQPSQGGGTNGGSSSGNGGGEGSADGSETGAAPRADSTSSVAGSATPSQGDKAGDQKNDAGDKPRDAKPSQSKSQTTEVSDDASAVAAGTPSSPDSPTRGSPAGLIAGVVVICCIGAAAFALARRRT